MVRVGDLALSAGRPGTLTVADGQPRLLVSAGGRARSILTLAGKFHHQDEIDAVGDTMLPRMAEVPALRARFDGYDRLSRPPARDWDQDSQT